jgi:lipoprotein-anchoring transpeptidase ErfK/SrfK
MRAVLGRAVAVLAAGLVITVTVSPLAPSAAASPPEPTNPCLAPSTTSTTVPFVEPTTTASPSSTSSTTTTPNLVVDAPDPCIPPVRGTQIQATDTLPPPPTTTTLPPGALPPGSGTGRRLVYAKTAQRTWIVEDDDTVTRTYRVSGRLTYNQPSPGTYSVFSKSGFTCNIRNPDICWRYMVRFTKGPDGDNIGFHEIPKKNGVPVQTEAQLGQPLSNGCIRQATVDAQFLYAWTPVGAKVVVLP